MFCSGCKTTGCGAVLFGLLRLLHIGSIRVRQDIANECCSSSRFGCFRVWALIFVAWDWILGCLRG